MVYNVPLSLLDSYRGKQVILRSHDPDRLVQGITEQDLQHIVYLQLTEINVRLDSLLRWEPSVPLDLVVNDIETDLPLLYKVTPLLANHAVRVSVPLVPGFAGLVKLALSLDFAVKLEFSQSAPDVTAELLDLAKAYLHQSTIQRPVEFIHSMFLSFYHKEPVTLWAVQEEDPSARRYVTDQGDEIVAKRCIGTDTVQDLPAVSIMLSDSCDNKETACRDCDFFAACRGYFQWPRKGYPCDGMKAVFRLLKDAAEELRRDVSSLQATKG